MSAKIKIPGSASNGLDRVHELRAMGLVQGKDFDFAYFPREDQGYAFGMHDGFYTEFTFYEEKYATMFALKWSR